MTAFANAIHYDGKVYNNMDELPPEARQKLQEAFTKLNQLGIVTAAPSAQAGQPFEPAFQASKPLLAQEPAIQESGGRNWMIIIGFLGAILVCAVALALVLFMR